MNGAWIIGLHVFSIHAPTCSAVAQEVHLANQREGRAHVVSESTSRCYRRITPGLYARAPEGVTVGAYRNSYGNASAYVGWSFEHGRFSLLIAGVTGYQRGLVVPLIAPSVRIELGERAALRVAAMPKPLTGSAALLHVAIERRF